MTLPLKSPVRRIAPPPADKRPIKENIYRVAQGANCQLFPVFPYSGPGDIVVTCSARRSRGGEDLGSFIHENSVDEVLIGFGGVGRVRTGMVRVGARVHGVGGVTGSDDDSYTVNTITQRQSEAEGQREAIAFNCSVCAHQLLRHEFDGSPETHVGEGALTALPTIVGSAAAVEIFNGDIAVRTCDNCGHRNDPFPIESWGWDQYVRRFGIAVDARLRLIEDGNRA